MKPLAFSTVLLGNILLSVFIGYQLDAWLNTVPIFLMIGLLYSVIGSIYILIYQSRKAHE